MQRPGRATLWLVTVAAFGGGLAACSDDSEITYEAFNAEGEAFTVEVGGELGEVAELPLFSTTGAVEVGLATIDPDSGPVGTEHLLEVLVDEEWAGVVDAVEVEVDSQDRGVRTYDLVSDSALEGLYSLRMTSVGEEDEVRLDTLTITLLDEVGDSDSYTAE